MALCHTILAFHPTIHLGLFPVDEITVNRKQIHQPIASISKQNAISDSVMSSYTDQCANL